MNNTLPRSTAPRRTRRLQAWPIAILLFVVACGGEMADSADMADLNSDNVTPQGGSPIAIPTQQADACPLDVTPPPYWELQEEPPSDGAPLRRRFTWGGDGEADATFAVEQVIGTPMLNAQRELWINAGGRLVATPTIVGAETPVVAGPVETLQGGAVQSQRWLFWLPAGLPERWVIFSLSLSVRSGNTWPDETAVLATISSAVPGRCLEQS